MRAVVLVALVLAGCAGAPAATPIVIYVTPPPATPSPSPTATPSPSPTSTSVPAVTPVAHNITVVFTLYGGFRNIGLSQDQTECFGHNGYDDIQLGMQVTLQDAQGAVLGFATFDSAGVPDSTTFLSTCTFTTIVHGVPDAPTYGVETGRRGKILFTRAEIAAHGWKAELSIGT